MTKKLEFVGISCNQCEKEEKDYKKWGFISGSTYKILKDGTVIRIQNHTCGHIEEFVLKSQKRKISIPTGIIKCEECGFEYIRGYIPNHHKFNHWYFEKFGFPGYDIFKSIFKRCPECRADDRNQKGMHNHEFVLMHNHDDMGFHPIDRKHIESIRG